MTDDQCPHCKKLLAHQKSVRNHLIYKRCPVFKGEIPRLAPRNGAATGDNWGFMWTQKNRYIRTQLDAQIELNPRTKELFLKGPEYNMLKNIVHKDFVIAGMPHYRDKLILIKPRFGTVRG